MSAHEAFVKCLMSTIPITLILHHVHQHDNNGPPYLSEQWNDFTFSAAGCWTATTEMQKAFSV